MESSAASDVYKRQELEGATLPRGPSKGRRGGGPGRMAVKSRLAEIKRATKRRRKR